MQNHDESCPMARAVREAYSRGEEDETLNPLVLSDEDGRPLGRLRPGDSLIFYNIRGEREGELTRALADSAFPHFPLAGELNLCLATMIEYEKGVPVKVAFPPQDPPEDTLCGVIAAHGLRQVKITEAEKAVHVGFFLNGKRAESFPGEERLIVPSRKDVALFDAAPEMSSAAITAAAIEKITEAGHDFIFVNLPNVDVVGHIENEPAVLRAVSFVDECAGRIVAAALKAGFTAIVTADHGTVEKWLYPEGTVDTGHTDSPVPFILVGEKGAALRPGGELADIAPTVLTLLGISPPPAMTGRSLLAAGPSPSSPASGNQRRRVLLLLLDGWGWRSEKVGNLIAAAPTPRFDELIRRWPWTTLEASGEAVGLPPGTVGNSEAGHLHIGSGRRIPSDRLRIDRAIADGTFYTNEVLVAAVRHARDNGRSLHLLGIVSFFSSHGSLEHLYALMELARREGVSKLYIHCLLGRRGERPESGARYVEEVERRALSLGLGKVVSVIGRYWAMDREKNWDRIERAYRLLVLGEGRLCGGH